MAPIDITVATNIDPDRYRISSITGETRGHFLACIFCNNDGVVYPFVQIYICSHSPFLSLSPLIEFRRNNNTGDILPKSVIFTDLTRNRGQALIQERFEKKRVTSRVSILWSDNVITIHTL